MGWPPAVVIVVRHGARLDAADKQWHLTSPTPYDPPLTYGGWVQSRALGARIASILRSRETDDVLKSTNGEGKNGANTRKRRHKVIIHTSPFLRCVQTSIAISSGLGQNPGHNHTHRSTSSLSNSQTKASQKRSSSKTRPSISIDSPKLSPIPEPESSTSKAEDKSLTQDNIKKATIRVDAFLGEWLSPDYFEQITPPPSSIMMVAGAKADLLRREDYSHLSNRQLPSSSSQGFPGGWGSPVMAVERDKDEGPLSSLSVLGQALPRRDRTSSFSSFGINGSRYSNRGLSSAVQSSPEHGIYLPPIPSYAISQSEPIPPGYVAHARDGCIEVDYQWDSMRAPQHWGHGGEYGEEWSSMHKRFRKGLQNLIGWYKTSDDTVKLMPRTHEKEPCTDSECSDDEDTDLVVILVTHGAGCNALIGALTNQPVLLDVGMSSLTMAVRKCTPENTPNSTPGHSRAPSRTFHISDEYDVKLVANTEHLRPSTSSTPVGSRTPSLSLPAFRERYATIGATDSGSYGRQTQSSALSGNFGSIRRPTSAAGPSSKSYVPGRQSSIGLWSATRSEEDDESEERDDMILNFGDDGATPHAPPEEKNEVAIIEIEKAEEEDIAPLGLWGASKFPGEAEKTRDTTPAKRRWTVNERCT
ncbi:hypothetical protein B7494_g5210 [Chlorociboria aeruginascens]|nr:hypothetical protein B7494_g5210 [Chlorociboria aeruginascens]